MISRPGVTGGEPRPSADGETSVRSLTEVRSEIVNITGMTSAYQMEKLKIEALVDIRETLTVIAQKLAVIGTRTGS